MNNFYDVSLSNCPVENIYNDENWQVDKRDDLLRVSYFEGGHYVNEFVINLHFGKDLWIAEQDLCNGLNRVLKEIGFKEIDFYVDEVGMKVFHYKSERY